MGVIAKLELLLGGEELTYPEIEGQIEFGNSTFNWTYEWPSQEDLEMYDILTVRDELQLSEIRYKQFEHRNELSGIQLVF